MNGNTSRTEARESRARADVPIDAGCITHDELAEWLKLVDMYIPESGISDPERRGPSDPPCASRLALAVATVAASATLAGFVFLTWLALKGVPLL